MNNQLIKKENGVFEKIINFFKKLFYKTENKEKLVPEPISINTQKEIKYDLNEEKTDKEEFMSLYEKAKNEEIDLYSLDEKTLERMCKLLEEEIKITKNAIEQKKQKIMEIEQQILKYQ